MNLLVRPRVNVATWLTIYDNGHNDYVYSWSIVATLKGKQ